MEKRDILKMLTSLAWSVMALDVRRGAETEDLFTWERYVDYFNRQQESVPIHEVTYDLVC